MFGRAGFKFHWMVAVAVTQQAPHVGGVEPDRAHALVLPPVRLLVANQALAVQVLGQDEDAPRREADARVAGRAQEPADDVGRGAGGHFATHPVLPVPDSLM